mmetsp:Transcript_14283/g.20903  ORF Transcript_14283/g.20903 Transcript_14283/m.20903 type:complete len:215 (+) Transcript_14283:236-880(+)
MLPMSTMFSRMKDDPAASHSDASNAAWTAWLMIRFSSGVMNQLDTTMNETSILSSSHVRLTVSQISRDSFTCGNKKLVGEDTTDKFVIMTQSPAGVVHPQVEFVELSCKHNPSSGSTSASATSLRYTPHGATLYGDPGLVSNPSDSRDSLIACAIEAVKLTNPSTTAPSSYTSAISCGNSVARPTNDVLQVPLHPAPSTSKPCWVRYEYTSSVP